MTICLINFPTKKLPVKVPPIVTTVSHSSLHWTLSLLSASCDKVKFKHPDFVEKFATDWLSAQEGELETEDWREILIAREAVGPPGMVQPRSGQGPDWRQYVHTWVLSPHYPGMLVEQNLTELIRQTTNHQHHQLLFKG